MIFEKTISREIEASPGAIFWNYWDHEHLYVVHKNYSVAYVLYEDNKMAVYTLRYHLPILPFIASDSMNIMIQHDPKTIKAYNMGILGVPVSTTITVEELRRDQCRLTMHYKFVLSGWKTVLKFFLPQMIEKWNLQVWLEDLPVKLRRHKVMRCGFKDFIGLPREIKDRDFQGEVPFELPIKRHKDSPVNLSL